jgi:hypothetical protein
MKATRQSGLVPMRIEFFTPGGAHKAHFVGMPAQYLRDWNHAGMCEVFGLNVAYNWFDAPMSMRGVGSAMSGAGGSAPLNRLISGFVFDVRQPGGRHSDPIGKISIIRESDKFKDSFDPTNASDFFR